MWTLWTGIFIASLVGSMHCVGMCGGFVAFYAGSDASQGWSAQWSHAAYHGGRLVTYMILGAVAGAVGAAFDVGARMAGFSAFAGWFAGSLMILWGVVAIAQQAGLIGRWEQAQRGPASWISTLYRKTKQRPPVVRAWLLGLSSTLLPCGWLYAFVLPAAATASPWQGALVMSAFWLGSVPLLLGLGLGIQRFSLRLRLVWPWLSAVMVLVIGIMTFWQRGLWAVPAFAKSKHKHHHGMMHQPENRTHSAKHASGRTHPAPTAGKASSQPVNTPKKVAVTPPCHHHTVHIPMPRHTKTKKQSKRKAPHHRKVTP